MISLNTRLSLVRTQSVLFGVLAVSIVSVIVGVAAVNVTHPSGAEGELPGWGGGSFGGKHIGVGVDVLAEIGSVCVAIALPAGEYRTEVHCADVRFALLALCLEQKT